MNIVKEPKISLTNTSLSPSAFWGWGRTYKQCYRLRKQILHSLLNSREEVLKYNFVMITIIPRLDDEYGLLCEAKKKTSNSKFNGSFSAYFSKGETLLRSTCLSCASLWKKSEYMWAARKKTWKFSFTCLLFQITQNRVKSQANIAAVNMHLCVPFLAISPTCFS